MFIKVTVPQYEEFRLIYQNGKSNSMHAETVAVRSIYTSEMLRGSVFFF